MHTPQHKFSTLVRVGFASRALLYIMLGYLGLTAAHRLQEGSNGIFLAIRELPLGTALLWAMVLGFIFYGLFRLASAVLDIENQGDDRRAKVTRAGHAASGIGHLALALTAYGFATYNAGGGSGAQEAAAGLLGVTLGGTVLGVLGLCFILAGLHQAKDGVTGSFMADIARNAPQGTRAMGTMGYLARAVVFAIIGWSLVDAGWFSGSSQRVKTLGEALAALSGWDPWFTLVAVGLLVFGLFSLILARYRIIPEVSVSARIREKRRFAVHL